MNDYERDIYATTQSTKARFNGNLHISRTSNKTAYGDLLLSGNKKLNENWELNFTAGTSIQHHAGKMIMISGSPKVPNVFLESALDNNTINIQNSDEKLGSPARKEVQSVFGTVQMNYRNKLYLDLSNRNDWSSTLAYTPSEKSGYNYFSAGAAVVMNEMCTIALVHRLPASARFLCSSGQRYCRIQQLPALYFYYGQWHTAGQRAR